MQELEQNIPMLEKIVAKPFDKEGELGQLKKDVSKLEREITLKIQEKQMKQVDAADENIVDTKEAPVVKIEKSLLPKKQVNNQKVKGARL